MASSQIKNSLIKVNRIVTERDLIKKELDKYEKEIVYLEDETELLDLVSSTLRIFIDKEVERGVVPVEALQTEGLQAVFDDQLLSVKAETSIQRGKISVELITSQNKEGKIIEGSTNDLFGGSILTVQSVLLRILVMIRRNLKRFIILDESLPAFDSNYISNMGEFLSELCRRLNIDILCVTQNPILAESADSWIKAVNKGGETVFEQVR